MTDKNIEINKFHPHEKIIVLQISGGAMAPPAPLSPWPMDDLSIFWEDGKKIVPLESRIAFCQLSIVRAEKVCYERKVRGNF